jgi:hypothetical protein
MDVADMLIEAKTLPDILFPAVLDKLLVYDQGVRTNELHVVNRYASLTLELILAHIHKGRRVHYRRREVVYHFDDHFTNMPLLLAMTLANGDKRNCNA